MPAKPRDRVPVCMMLLWPCLPTAAVNYYYYYCCCYYYYYYYYCCSTNFISWGAPDPTCTP